MCAQFIIKANAEKLARRYGLVPTDTNEQFDWPERVVPYRPAPVIVSGDDRQRHLRTMNFSLIPSWSKEPKVKFATHNARLDTIDEKPTWKKPFLSHHCVVPLNAFVEPIYTGDFAGFMVAFQPTDDSLLSAAAIYDIWINKQSGEVIESFSIITDEPSDFVARIGHDRQPVFLRDEALDEWLQTGHPAVSGGQDSHGKGASTRSQNAAALKAFLRENRQILDLRVDKDRPMRPGWEKRKS